MPSTSIERSRVDGDWQSWDRIWRGMDQTGVDAVLYTPGKPRTLLEFWQRAYFDDLWTLMQGRAEDGRFLELGSGRGTTSMYLASRRCDVTLVDLSSTALELAARNFRSFGLPPPHTHRGDAADSGLPSAAFDCVYNIGLLEHFDDPIPVLKEALRLLKPQGVLFMVVIPEYSPWQAVPLRLLLNPGRVAPRLAVALRRWIAGRRPPPPAAGEHLVRVSHSRARYVRWMRELGQRDVQCVPYNPYVGIYRSRALERLVTVPLYRQHLRRTRRMWTGPRLQTSASAALCDLLLCRKV
jgi:SAM-dependent methyltransferase